MTPDVFNIAKQSAAVTALLGTGAEMRLWPFGYAKQNQGRPYAVWQVVYGNPGNSLSCVPKEDLFGCQFDAFAKTASEARDVASALRDAFESEHYPVVGYNGEFWEQNTGLYRVSFTVEFWTERLDS
jgi:hypothetical protein